MQPGDSRHLTITDKTNQNTTFNYFWTFENLELIMVIKPDNAKH